MHDLSAFYSRRFAFSRARFRQQQQEIDSRDASKFSAAIAWEACAGESIERDGERDGDDDATGPSETIEHDANDCQKWGACPHVDRNDARCGHRFSIGRLDQAFSVCFGSFHACPLYHRINSEVAIDPPSAPQGEFESERQRTLVEIRVLAPHASHSRAGSAARPLAGPNTGLGQLRQTGS